MGGETEEHPKKMNGSVQHFVAAKRSGYGNKNQK
jgi:hypothetical protein